MNILFVVNSFEVGGAERHSLDLAHALQLRGHKCTMASVRPKTASDLHNSDFTSVQFLYCDAKGFLDWTALNALAKQISLAKPDVLIAVNQYSLMYASLARVMLRQKILLATILHTTKILSFKERLMQCVYKYFFARADLLVYVCEYQARYWAKKHLGARREAVLHNGIDALRYRPADMLTRTSIRECYNISSDDFVIGITARFRPEKNHAFLIRALKIMRARGLRLKLIMIGDGPLQIPMEKYARELNVVDDAIFVGSHKDVRPFLAAVDVFVLASTSETFSVSALEAMAMGIPAVLSDVGGAREMVSSNVNGFIYPANDMESFLEAIEKLMEPGAARTMGGHAYEIVSTRFAHDIMVDGYCELLENVIGFKNVVSSS